MEQFNLACELAKLIRHFFPDLVPLLKQLPDLRNQSYTTYPGVVDPLLGNHQPVSGKVRAGRAAGDSPPAVPEAAEEPCL